MKKVSFDPTLPPPPAEPELVHVEYVENPEEEEAKRIEERRKRREALLSKLQSAPSAAPTEPLAPVAPVTPAIVSEPQQTGAQMEFSEEGEEGDAGLRTPEAKPGTATPDMFAETPMDGLEEGPGVAVNRGDNLLLAENWDDVEGYYRIQVGEQLGNRYKVFATYGKGVFSTVVKTKDSQTGQDMAIKIVRHNESM